MSALVAIALGSVLAVLLLIPTAAVQYRLDGRLGPLDLLVLGASAVYALSIWTYTLLPLPEPGTYRCQGAQLQLFGSIGEIRLDVGPLALLREPAFSQVVLNVLLFVPLGWFLRVILKRGVVVGTLVGLAVSLLVELTQRTGVWGIYDCAYRLFDVDDLLVNTLGAAIGSLLAITVVRRRRPDVVLPTTITFGRRVVAMVCDVLFIALTGALAALAWRAWEVYVREEAVDRGVQAALQWGVPFAVEAALVLGLGCTVGELTVALRTRARKPSLLVPGRLVKLATGVGPVFLLALPRFGIALVAAFAVLSLVVAWRTRDHRGLSNTLGGLDLQIRSEVRSAASAPPSARDA